MMKLTYILNEKKFILNVIENNLKIEDVDCTVSKVAFLLAKYLKNIQLVKSFLSQMMINSNGFYVEKYEDVIRKMVNKVIDNDLELIERDFISIYQSDLDLIDTLETNREKKILFSAIVLARYNNKDGWVGLYTSSDYNELFKLANVSMKKEEKYILIGRMIKKGYFIKPQINDKINLKVNFDKIESRESNPIVLKVSNIQYLGNQYLTFNKKDWITCVRCGKRVKKTNNRQKYCTRCAYEKKLENKRISV